MRDRNERFVVLPFSFGCASQESVAVGSNEVKMSKQDRNSSPEKQEEAGSSSGVKAKNSFSFIVVPLQKLIKSFKRFSQLFVYGEEEDEEDEEEKEIEIGFPTDVKHVSHIGWDGSTTTNPVKGWENLKAPEILAFPTISLKQFELAMAAQADRFSSSSSTSSS